MAYEAVDVFGIAEVIGAVFVAIASMALRTTGFVRRNSDTEVIEDIVLTVDSSLESFDIRCSTFPLEVSCIDKLVSQFTVAVQAGLSAFVGVLCEIAFVQLIDFIRIGSCTWVSIMPLGPASPLA